MKLQIISGSQHTQPALAKIYSNGTLALNSAAREQLEITLSGAYQLALAADQTHKPAEKLYLVFMDKASDATRKLTITDKSCTVNFSQVFSAFGMDYKKDTFVYHLAKQTTWQGNRVVVLERKK